MNREAMESIVSDIVNNTLLYGKDGEERIVGAYQRSDTLVRIFNRTDSGKVTFHDEPCYPYFFLSESTLLSNFRIPNGGKYWPVALSGNNFYRSLAIFQRWKDYREALDHIARNSRTGMGDDAEEPTARGFVPNTYSKGDAVTQYMMQTGKTFFKGMIFDDLYRMQLDIETLYDPKNKPRTGIGIGEDEIIIVSLSDNRGWEKVIHGKEQGEKALLEQLVDIISERNPDVIEGHNIFGFDLPYLQARCSFHSIPFAIGRDGLVPKSYPASIRFAERSIDYLFFDIPGRNVIDTLFLVQSYDISKRSMQSYGLKAVARHFGFASENRTYVDYSEIADLWRGDTDRLLRYALDDVRETCKLSSLLSGSNFYLTQMLPFTYAQTARMGQAAKIEALMTREYLRVKHSLPKPSAGRQQFGGYTAVFLKGVLGPIVYADVESLYPSIMLSSNICPRTDELRAFPGILTDLKALRLKTKGMAADEKAAGNGQLSANYDAMQSSFKILINAMYGYLGFAGGIFNDFAEADRVTSTGQSIARQMIREFEAEGCRIIEVDTDGILFIPPDSVTTEAQERDLVQKVSTLMPEGIRIGFDGRFRKMISYMKKNYALLDYSMTMTLKGSSLTSRSGEKFGRDLVERGFKKLLAEDIDGLHNLYTHYRNKILNHELDITEFSRTESMKSSLEQYLGDVQAGKRQRAVTYEIARRKGGRITKGDRITYYISGSGNASASFDRGKAADEWRADAPDENTAFYLKRLDEHCQKFLPFFKPQDFSMIFSDDTLFPFSAEGIMLQEKTVSQESQGEENVMDGEQ
ncbi:DNA polymerase [Chlorobium phaeovibrioides]|uniref:DNA-directed DNA polymerase n=2 Tax=Chlorobium phaeovibrioides TaxID=1094 RepID=A0ABW9UQE5_CHLPH|nr:DNA polymerase [Chlorobium phaeovibrioides]